MSDDCHKFCTHYDECHMYNGGVCIGDLLKEGNSCARQRYKKDEESEVQERSRAEDREEFTPTWC